MDAQTHRRVSGILIIGILTAVVSSSVPSATANLNATSIAEEATPSTTFKFSLDFFSSDTGYYKVEGYEGIQPDLEMEVGVVYTFDQTNTTNWMHPLGFAYYPDGAHEGKDEVEEDSLVYLINGVQPEENLDGYEPEFFYPLEAWLQKNYTVQLTITPEIAAKALGGEIFYFCHIHNGMSGRIKIKGAEANGAPVELYAPYQAGEFDTMCGTYETAAYAADASPNLCPDQVFLCNEGTSPFDRCMHAIDCKMNYEMRVVTEGADNEVATFMHQMIPHHDNAVNMAKILLKHGGDMEEEVENMLYEIINTQNAQITMMRGWLSENGYGGPEDVLCDVLSLPSGQQAVAADAGTNETSSAAVSRSSIIVVALVAVLGALFY